MLSRPFSESVAVAGRISVLDGPPPYPKLNCEYSAVVSVKGTSVSFTIHVPRSLLIMAVPFEARSAIVFVPNT